MYIIYMKNIFDDKLATVHFIGVVVLIVLPFVASNKYLKTYGSYFASFMLSVITIWIILDKCPITSFEQHDNKHGSAVEYIHHNLGVPIDGHEHTAAFIVTALYTLSAMKFASYNKYLQIAIALAGTTYMIKKNL